MFIYTFVFFNVTATTEIYTYLHTLPLHDALPISPSRTDPGLMPKVATRVDADAVLAAQMVAAMIDQSQQASLCEDSQGDRRSEEHTSELQSLMRISYAVFCLKKNNTRKILQNR